VFAECNAVAPSTACAIAELFAPDRFADAGIVGRAPREHATPPTRLYVSGAARRVLMELANADIRVIDMGPEVGRASAIKMAYASLNKGTDALHAAVLLAAQRLGVRAELMQEFELSQPVAARRMADRVPYLAATAERFAGEMAEIAATYEAAGVTPLLHRGAEWVFERLASTELGAETRATLPAERSLDAALAVFAKALEQA
jgi:3-hydroxyisobutyrate dehydrogenase-like beta-hydroxyacid dehydrogenase